MTSTALRVYLDGTPIGTLEQNGSGRMAFHYDEDYRDAVNPTPLSLSMPLSRETHTHRAVNAYLWGLLPDNRGALVRIGREFGVSPNNPMSLLSRTGRDAAGAVQILPVGENPSDAAPQGEKVTRLESEQFRRMMTSLATDAADWDPGQYAGRWSLAGAQTKAALGRTQLLTAARSLRVDQANANATIDRIRSGVAGAFADAAQTVAPEFHGAAMEIANAVHALGRARGYGDD